MSRDINLREMNLFGQTKKEEKVNSLSHSIDAAGTNAYYDVCCKRLLSHKVILAWIMKSCLKEFEGFDIETVKSCIGNDLSVSANPVHQNEVVMNEDTEDNTITEGMIRYDIRFTASVPNCKDKVCLIINVEGQNDSYPGYPLVKRGLYYCSRLISSQHGSIFANSNYGDIVKVYSIWVCTGNFERVNPVITNYSVKKEDVYGESSVSEEDYDLMSLVMIYLCKDADSVDVDIIKLLTYLLSPNIQTDKKKKTLTEEFKIEMTEDLYKEVGNMSGIAEKLLEEGREQGIEQGREEGKKEGAEQVTALYKELMDAGKVEDMYKAINDAEYRKELLRERYGE